MNAAVAEAAKSQLVIEIPPGFGRDLLQAGICRSRRWIDGAMPFLGETARDYVSGVARAVWRGTARSRGLPAGGRRLASSQI